MNLLVERRKSNREAEEALSPEFLALLAVCGGEIRAGDRAVLLANRRSGDQGNAAAAAAAAPADARPLPSEPL